MLNAFSEKLLLTYGLGEKESLGLEKYVNRTAIEMRGKAIIHPFETAHNKSVIYFKSLHLNSFGKLRIRRNCFEAFFMSKFYDF
jgi:hypothetical protein